MFVVLTTKRALHIGIFTFREHWFCTFSLSHHLFFFVGSELILESTHLYGPITNKRNLVPKLNMVHVCCFLTTKRSLDIGNVTFRETCFAKTPQFKTPHRPSVLSKTHPLHITTILFADSKKNMDAHVVDTNTHKNTNAMNAFILDIVLEQFFDHIAKSI